MQDKKLLMIGLATEGQHSAYFTQSLMGMQFPTNVAMEYRAVDGRPVDEARNILVQMAVDMNAKYLMMFDEDVIGPLNGVRTLLFHLENHSNWTVCGGIYASKTYPPEPLVYKEWGMGAYYGWKKGEMIPVKGTGCGFHMFRVADLAAMQKPEVYEVVNPFNNEPMKVRRYFHTGDWYEKDEQGRSVHNVHTEDTFFYKMCEEEGYQVWLDSNILCLHYDRESKSFFVVPIVDEVATLPDAWNMSPSVCNLGSGKVVNPFEVNVDLIDMPGVFRCDIRKLPDDWAEHFDLVKAHHVLEHFEYLKVEEILREWVRLIKPGGTLEIRVPDLEYAANEILRGVNDPYLLSLIYGDQGNEFWRQNPYGEEKDGRYMPWSNENNSHKSGFTAKILVELLQKIGLVKLEGEKGTFALQVRGKKPNGKDESSGTRDGVEEPQAEWTQSRGLDSGDRRLGELHAETNPVDPVLRTDDDDSSDRQPIGDSVPPGAGSGDHPDGETKLLPGDQPSEESGG